MKKLFLFFAILLLTISTVSAADPVAYYKLDGNANDSAGSYDGTNSGASFDVGYWNQSMCTGSTENDYITTTYTTDLSQPMTVSFWINRHESFNNVKRIFENFNSYNSGDVLISTRYGSKIRFRYGATDIGSTIEAPLTNADEWYHIVWTHDPDESSATYSVYLNGEKIGTVTWNSAKTMSEPFIIGSYYANDVDIDDVKVYDCILTESEVLDIYQNSVHNSFVLSAYDELNQTQLDITSFNIYNENQSVSTGTLIDGDYYVYSTQFDTLGKYIASVNVDEYYSRNSIVENGYTPFIVSTYLPPESETVIYEQFTLNDNVALYEPSDIIIRLDKPMGSSSETVYSSYFDMNSQAATYLIPADAYILYIITPTETINYGWLYPDADGSVTILLNAFEFDVVDEWLDYTYECTDAAVSFDYTSSKAVSGASFIITYDNGTSAYSASAETDAGSFTYNFPGNATYKIDINVDAEDENTFTMQKFIEIGKSNQNDFFPASYSLMLKSIVVMFGIILGVVGLSSYRSDLSAMWAFGLYAFAVYQDWIFGNVISVSILGIIALAAVKKFQKRESRM